MICFVEYHRSGYNGGMLNRTWRVLISIWITALALIVCQQTVAAEAGDMSVIGWPEVDRSTVVSITMLATSTRAISSTSKTTITRAITAKRPITPVSEIPADWVPPTPDTLNGKKEIESDVKASRPAVRVMTMGLSGLTLKIVRKAPGVSMFFEDIDTKAAGEAMAQLIDYGISRWGNKDEVELLRQPERKITPHFLELLAKACEKQRVVLMFDVFERTCDALSPWLLTLLT